MGLRVRQAFGAVYERLGWESLFGSRRKATNRMIRKMVLVRIARPQSKPRLETERALALNLDTVYRGMDALNDARVEAICALSRDQAQTLVARPRHGGVL